MSSYWTAFFKAVPECKSCDAKLVSPFAHRKGFSIVRNQYIGGPVVPLLFRGSPLTVIWFVIPVIVDSVKLVLGRRTFAHIGKEVIKQFPAITNDDASSSIAVIHPRFWIKASSFHRAPNVVLRLIRLAMTKAVTLPKVANRFHKCGRSLFEQTAARTNYARIELTNVYRFCVATIAKAFNKSLATGRDADHGFDRQTTGFGTNQHVIRYAFHS